MLKNFFILLLVVPGFALAMPDPVADPLAFKQSIRNMSDECQALVEKSDKDLCMSQILKNHREAISASQKRHINKYFSGTVERERARRAREY